MRWFQALETFPTVQNITDWKVWAARVVVWFRQLQVNPGFVELPTYSVDNLPKAAGFGLIYVTDEAGGAVPAFSDGTNWRRVTDRTIVS